MPSRFNRVFRRKKKKKKKHSTVSVSQSLKNLITHPFEGLGKSKHDEDEPDNVVALTDVEDMDSEASFPLRRRKAMSTVDLSQVEGPLSGNPLEEEVIQKPTLAAGTRPASLQWMRPKLRRSASTGSLHSPTSCYTESPTDDLGELLGEKPFDSSSSENESESEEETL